MAERREQAAAPDAVLTRIGQVVMLHHGGDREEARSRFLDLWAEIGQDGDPLHRCTLAHYLADTQDDPADELAWDLRALSAAEEAGETGRPREPGESGESEESGEGTGVRGFLPSLHLNLAADYVKLGRAEAARSHLRRARSAADALADDGYGNGVRAAIGRLELRLGKDGGPAGGEQWGPPRPRPS
ncbi:hypothetical protein NX794_05440 [Streptomyces sp. LP11]|uniref:Tetratricopeptide repeat protein n=1 Tax=Streptomyces pyxinicus TaxID=2970331 RepID=A0ABT2AWZ6_9ACTN|nr:hypothetical protein [Streptomyces sp. LP11]MCS0600676.1 hypothetical protein [Streptomyces sp. LP11]